MEKNKYKQWGKPAGILGTSVDSINSRWMGNWKSTQNKYIEKENLGFYEK